MECPISPERRLVLSIDDLSNLEVTQVLDSARRFAREGFPAIGRTGFSLGLLMLAPSLRTRVGFAQAAVRLGGTPIEVAQLRVGAGMSTAESFEDTLRILTGMVDGVVVRVPFTLEHQAVAAASVSPVISGGDGNREHPTQALIDLLAMEEEQGPIGELRVGLCGDLRSRAARSLLKLLDRFPPRSLTLQAPPGRNDPGVALGPLLSSRTSFQSEADFTKMDVLYMVGLPEGAGASHLSSEQRAAFALSVQRLWELPKDAVVLSAMPVIDEIAPEARGDQRVRMFIQSDRGIFVRAAVLELVLETIVPGGH